MVFGIIFFILIITGLILNTIFLVREIKRNEQHDAFLNSVTHELKTPIASIKLYLETLKSRDVAKEKQAEFYDIMLADADRLLGTVEQVLQAGRLREKNRKYNVVELDLRDVLQTSVNAVLSRYNLVSDVIRFVGPPQALMVVGDASELETAFINLLDNAVKYSGTEPKILVRMRRVSGNNSASILIKDNGFGIPANDFKRIFKRFYRSQSKASKEAKGTGLGLFIVQTIIKNHGGTITAESKGEGKGSTFLIRMPLV